MRNKINKQNWPIWFEEGNARQEPTENREPNSSRHSTQWQPNKRRKTWKSCTRDANNDTREDVRESESDRAMKKELGERNRIGKHRTTNRVILCALLLLLLLFECRHFEQTILQINRDWIEMCKRLSVQPYTLLYIHLVWANARMQSVSVVHLLPLYFFHSVFCYYVFVVWQFAVACDVCPAPHLPLIPVAVWCQRKRPGESSHLCVLPHSFIYLAQKCQPDWCSLHFDRNRHFRLWCVAVFAVKPRKTKIKRSRQINMRTKFYLVCHSLLAPNSEKIHLILENIQRSRQHLFVSVRCKNQYKLHRYSNENL